MYDIAILEDHPLVSRITREVVEACAPGISIQAFEELKDFIRFNDRPRAILADLMLPDAQGLDVVETIQQRYPNTPLLICTGVEAEHTLYAIEDRGLKYINKRAKTSDMVEKIRELLKISRILKEEEDILNIVDTRNSHQSGIIASGSSKPLTHKQVQIMECCAQGLSSKETARELCLSMDTVRSHMTEIFLRLGAKNVAQAVDIFNRAKRAADLRGQGAESDNSDSH